MTRKTALALGIGASLILAAGTASANCATEVRALQEQLGAIDTPNARTGPSDTGVQQPDPSAPVDMSATDSTTMSPTTDEMATQHGGANATIGPTDPGVQQPDPSAPTDLSAADSTTTGTTMDTNDGSSVATQDTTGANATIGPSDPGVQQPQNEDMDVTADTSDSSTTAPSTTMPSGTVGTGTIAETTRSGQLTTPADSRSVAISSLKKAQLYADAGQEEACMSELDTAKQHLGVD